jgi:hypothetical protein
VEPSELIEGMVEGEVCSLASDDLAELLEVAETLRAEDTRLSGWIRILSLDGRVVVQEETPDGELLLRTLGSRTSAERFVQRRLADYERMWDGCGCRIDYHD